MDKKLRQTGPQPGDLPTGAGAPEAHLADRLECCLDRWWTPPPLADGTIRVPPIERHALDAAARAHERLESRATTGALVLIA